MSCAAARQPYRASSHPLPAAIVHKAHARGGFGYMPVSPWRANGVCVAWLPSGIAHDQLSALHARGQRDGVSEEEESLLDIERRVGSPAISLPARPDAQRHADENGLTGCEGHIAQYVEA